MLEESMFSRIHTHPLGKCIAEVGTSLPEEAKDAIAAMAFARGVTPAEYLRSLILNHLYGSVTMLRLHHKQHGDGTVD